MVKTITQIIQAETAERVWEITEMAAFNALDDALEHLELEIALDEDWEDW